MTHLRGHRTYISIAATVRVVCIVSFSNKADMSSITTTVADVEQGVATLKLRSSAQEEEQQKQQEEQPYRYAHLLPHFSADRYPPLTPFEHVDPGHRALTLPNPRAFLENATFVDELTPHLGTEVHGVNLAELDGSGRDQLALEVRLLIYLVMNGNC